MRALSVSAPSGVGGLSAARMGNAHRSATASEDDARPQRDRPGRDLMEGMGRPVRFSKVNPSLRPAYFRFFAAAREFLREATAGRDSLTARHRRQRRGQAVSWRLRFGHPGLHRRLHLLESAHLDLPHALTRNVEFGRELLERNRVVSQPAGLEDTALAGIEHAQRAVQSIHANARFLAVGEQRFLIHGVIDQPVLPLALAALAQRRIEGSVAAETGVPFHLALLPPPKPPREPFHLVVAQIALVERGYPALGLAQVEEQLLLARRRAHLYE